MHVTDASHRKGTEASPILLSPSCQNDTFLALKVLALLTPVQTSGIQLTRRVRQVDLQLYFGKVNGRTLTQAELCTVKGT